MNKRNLTTWEAACIITGYGVGGGVLSIPYLAEKTGLPLAFVILAIALFTSYILHLMIADLALKTQEGGQIISCLSQFLFRGKLKKVLTMLFFILMTLILFTNLSAYISGSVEIIVELLPVPRFLATLAFYIVAASVVFFGLKAVGISEKYLVAFIFCLIGALSVASFFTPANALPLVCGSANEALALYGMAMFAIAAFFSVPQGVEGLNKEKREIKRAIFLGLFNNFIIIILITFCSLLASDEVTEVVMVGWSAAIGPWAQIVVGLFTILAMLTTYWSLSLALGSIVQEQMKWDRRLCWLVATLPSLVLSLIDFASFMEFMRMAGGLISIIIAIMVVLAYLNARREVEGSILNHYGGKVTAAAVIAAYILMGIGSVVPV